MGENKSWALFFLKSSFSFFRLEFLCWRPKKSLTQAGRQLWGGLRRPYYMHNGSDRIQCLCHDQQQRSETTCSKWPEIMTFVFGPASAIKRSFASYIMSSVKVKNCSWNWTRPFLNPWIVRSTFVSSVYTQSGLLEIGLKEPVLKFWPK